jgi:hypothetical protein
MDTDRGLSSLTRVLSFAGSHKLRGTVDPCFEDARRAARAAARLMSYGANLRDAFARTVIYVGRILKRMKPLILRCCSRPKSSSDQRRRCEGA